MTHEQRFDDDLEKLVALIAGLREEETLDLVRDLIDRGGVPWEILDYCQRGMRAVGDQYEDGQYFIAGLILAGEILRQTLELLRPLLITSRPASEKLGRIMLGTIAGDIHDIGKNIFKDLLECHGFSVLDLGVDVPPEEFWREAKTFKPDLIGVSVLVTESFPALCRLIHLFQASSANGKDKPLILVGGGQVDHQLFTISGADYWETDALSAVKLCKRLLVERGKVSGAPAQQDG